MEISRLGEYSQASINAMKGDSVERKIIFRLLVRRNIPQTLFRELQLLKPTSIFLSEYQYKSFVKYVNHTEVTRFDNYGY